MNNKFVSFLLICGSILVCCQACTSVKDHSIRTQTPSVAHEKIAKKVNQDKPDLQEKRQGETQGGKQGEYNSKSWANQTIISSNENLLLPCDEEVVALPPSSEEQNRQKESLEITREKPRSLSSLNFEFSVRETETMWDFYNYYTQKKKRIFQKWLKRAESYLPYIHKVFREQGLPDDLIFLPFAESGFNPRAYSWAGAAGLWQFMPSTGRHYGLTVNWWIDERRDPYKSTQAAAKYLKKLYNQFNDWYLALAAYNAGEGTIARALESSGSDNYFELKNKTRYLKRETQKYVPKLFAILKIVRNFEEFDFDPVEWKAEAEPNFIKVPAGTDLKALSRELNLDWSTFRSMNPAFRRSVSPPQRNIKILLPQNLVKTAKNFLKKSKRDRYAGCHRYRIRSGDSWWKLSRRFDIPISVLKGFNNIRTNILRPGQYVLIPGHRAGSYLAKGNNTGKPIDEYRVKAGDSLWSIASRFDVTVQALRRSNNFYKDARSLQKGQKISIPLQDDRQKIRNLAQKRANYKVRKGDTLWDISERFEVSLKTLVQANGITKNKTLDIGMKLYIPDMSNSASKMAQKRAGAAHEKIVSYQVRKGDSLWDIAQRFGVETGQLLVWNNHLSKEDYIQPGEELKIYVD